MHGRMTPGKTGEAIREALESADEVRYVDGHLVLQDGDVIKVNGKGTFNRQRFGTVSGSARQYRENETAALDKAIERGHKLVWLNAEAVVIADTPVDRSYKAEVNPGEIVYVDSPHGEERGFYSVELPRPRHLDGDSCRLVPVDVEKTNKVKLIKGEETRQIRDKLEELVKSAPAGGLFHDATVIPTARNEFWMEIDGPNGQEFLVTITHTVTKPRGL